jgi:hypothetical protein
MTENGMTRRFLLRSGAAIGVGVTAPWAGSPGEAAQAEGRGSGLTVSELFTEYAVNPVGVDVPRPRLAWLLESGRRGQLQSAYQIVVASSEDLLKGTRQTSGTVAKSLQHSRWAFRTRVRSWSRGPDTTGGPGAGTRTAASRRGAMQPGGRPACSTRRTGRARGGSVPLRTGSRARVGGGLGVRPCWRRRGLGGDQ